MEPLLAITRKKMLLRILLHCLGSFIYLGIILQEIMTLPSQLIALLTALQILKFL